MVAEAITGIQIFAQLFNTAKGLSDIHDATVRDKAVFTLQREILEAQAQQSALIQRVGDLEKEVARFEAWSAEKQRYELVQVGGAGVSAYRIKQSVQGAEPEHYLCTRCYEDHRKSILQQETRFPGRTVVLTCPRCKADLYISGGRQMA